jgi:Asp-tRNA(Asn)/Glu-tRNA(Gln) amidotransferase A subunit family amidase
MVHTIHAAAADIRAGRLSPVDLLESCLERIDRLEERIRAWVLVDREGARAEAKRLTDELRRGQYRGPLHGIPIGVKDIFDVFDWPTAAGSRLWANSIARQDATVVRKLREAGAVLVGKTVTTQYASFDPPPTRNPWNPERTPGGSSSGSAAAVATGMCLGALGSQTGGSITRPASYCGVAGCKPSYGRVSCRGVVPLAHSMDHPGPIGNCVRDLAILLQTIAGFDQGDSTSRLQLDIDLLAAVDGETKAPGLGRLRGLFEERAEPAVRRMMDQVVKELTDNGCEVVDVALPAGFSEVIARHRIVMAVEAAQFHEQRLRKHPEDYGPNITKLLEEGIACPAAEFARTKEHQKRLGDELWQSLGTANPVLLCPATTGPAPDKNTTGDPAFNSPWSYTGMPTVSFPVGLSDDGLPLAIQLVGAQMYEDKLFRAAAWCENVFAGRMPEPPL